ncbi:MAG TPA: PIG-L deacetylase family protein [Candidatus Nanoarchaeia archaeon]|nr:PIG-L deacetylase family protein [Candidatus Nanoarchaeia archaeon]
MKNILVVGAHPDDIELGCGGTIARHLEQNNRVYALVLTNGEQGAHAPQMVECLASLKSLGIADSDILFANYRDGHINDDHDTVDYIEKMIRKLGIDVVYANDPNDNHQDHRNTSRAVSSAARKVNSILLFQGPSTTVSFQPHYFIGLKERHIKKKIESLANYRTQIAKGCFSLQWIESLAKVNGARCGAPYAESFAINHIFEGH